MVKFQRIRLERQEYRLDVTEAIIYYLIKNFKDIRVIIPHDVMSTSTMIACTANKIIMGKHSFLGPIDPKVALTHFFN